MAQFEYLCLLKNSLADMMAEIDIQSADAKNVNPIVLIRVYKPYLQLVGFNA